MVTVMVCRFGDDRTMIRSGGYASKEVSDFACLGFVPQSAGWRRRVVTEAVCADARGFSPATAPALATPNETWGSGESACSLLSSGTASSATECESRSVAVEECGSSRSVECGSLEESGHFECCRPLLAPALQAERKCGRYSLRLDCDQWSRWAGLLLHAGEGSDGPSRQQISPPCAWPDRWLEMELRRGTMSSLHEFSASGAALLQTRPS